MSEKIIFATGNAGKLKEIREILKDLNREIVTMREAGFEGEIEENGTTFRENAEIKAKAVWEKTGGIVLADDSGLVIDYLNGEPGVYSARYLGDTPYEEKNRILIERVKDAKGKERSARFMCNIAAVLPDGRSASHRKRRGGARLQRKRLETADLDMIRFSGCRSTAKRQQSSRGGEKPYQPPGQGAGADERCAEGGAWREMKKILITSDTHRRDGNLLEVIQNEAPFDMFIHLGDARGK